MPPKREQQFAEALAALQALLGERVEVEVSVPGGPIAYFQGTLVCDGDMGPDTAVRFSFAEYGRDCGFWVDPYPELFEGAERTARGVVPD